MWCQLGDVYTHTNRKIACYEHALQVAPRDSEANAELAGLYAKIGADGFARCFDKAIANLRASDVEDSVLLALMDAAGLAGDDSRSRAARLLGHARFPDNSLFAK